jgi:hypothetical protein
MQHKAFKSWINSQMKQHLGETAAQVNDLATDLCDGTVLIELLAALYKHKGVVKPTYTKNPKLKIQFLDNAALVVQMLEQAGMATSLIRPKSRW